VVGLDRAPRPSGYRRIDMPAPAEPPTDDPSIAPGPSDATVIKNRPRGRFPRTGRPRIAAAVIAVFGGIALLTAGIVQTSGGLAGISMASPAAGVVSAAPAGGGPAPSGSAGTSPGPTVAPTASPTASPGGVHGVDSADVRTRLQATLDRLRTKLAIPGVSVTILLPDGTSWTGVSGLANVAAGTPVKPTTAFALASMSKTFISALLVELIEEGRIRLTDSAARFLPGLVTPLDRRITVAMLLDHTSGLNDYFLNPKIDTPLQADPTRAWSTDEALHYVRKPYFAPGRGWHYSNTNYLLLGLIAERVTGQSLDVAIRRRLLDPNGLTRTWYQGAEKSRTTLAHGYRFPGTRLTVRPIDLDDGSGIAPFRSVVSAAAGAGSLAGTSGDLARWARRLYSGEVLGPAGTARLLSGFSATAAYRPSVAYGYGVQAVVIDGHPSLGHSGRLLGFRGVVRHLPVEGLTIALLTNQSRADPATIVQALVSVVFPPAPPCPVCRRFT
jgi:D-alanyl-D-alanine carboxypeptidase